MDFRRRTEAIRFIGMRSGQDSPGNFSWVYENGLVRKDPDLGTVFGSDKRTRRPFGEWSRLVASELWAEIVPPYLGPEYPYPNPPHPSAFERERKAEGEADEDLAYRYVLFRASAWAAFSGAGHSRPIARKTLLRRKDYAKIVRSCVMLREAEISPAAWGYFCTKFVRRSENTPIEYLNRPGPFRQMFAPKFVGSMLKAVHDHCPVFAPAKQPADVAPTFARWRTLHAAMMNELDRCRPTTREEISAVVDRFFPGRLHESMKREADHECQEARRAFREQIAKGIWVWHRGPFRLDMES